MPSSPDVVNFETRTAGAATLHGNGVDGAVQLNFVTMQGQLLVTVFGPQLARMLHDSLGQALAASPTPHFAAPSLGRDVPGKASGVVKPAVFFDQEYPADLLQALGVLVIRVNLIEKSLVKLLAALIGQSEQFAEAMFYATSNNKARIDLLLATLPHADLVGHEGSQLSALLTDYISLSKQRNALIHGHWAFKKEKFTVHTYEPGSKGKKTQLPIASVRSLLQLAADYRTCGMALDGHALTIAARNTATKIAPTPSSSSSSVPVQELAPPPKADRQNRD